MGLRAVDRYIPDRFGERRRHRSFCFNGESDNLQKLYVLEEHRRRNRSSTLKIVAGSRSSAHSKSSAGAVVSLTLTAAGSSYVLEEQCR